MSATLNADDIAYWYLRLNGSLCLRNFLVHGDRRGEDRTEMDAVRVRFRYRREHLSQPMLDDDWVERAESDDRCILRCEEGRV